MIVISIQRISVVAAIVCLLTACSQEPESAPAAAPPDPAPESAASDNDPEPNLDRLVEDPQALREAMRDPERRDALIRAMRERRTSDESREEVRARLRQRREEILARQDDGERGAMLRGRRSALRGEWWKDESIAADMELASDQTAAIAASHALLDQARIDSRQARAGSQRELLDAIARADRERVEALLDERTSASVELARAEAQWLRTLIEQLNDAQLETLARQYPQLFLGRF